MFIAEFVHKYRSIIRKASITLISLLIIGFAAYLTESDKKIEDVVDSDSPKGIQKVSDQSDSPPNNDQDSVIASEFEQPQGAYYPELNSMKLFKLVQDWRKKNGYEVYVWDNDLEDEAYERLEEIKKDWSHSRFWQMSQQRVCGDKECWFGENLAKDWYSEESLLGGWLNSPSHLANLKATYSSTYIACKESYCVQIFRSFNYVPKH